MEEAVCQEVSRPVEDTWSLLLNLLEMRGYEVRSMRGEISRYTEATGDLFSARVEATGPSTSMVYLRIGQMDATEREQAKLMITSIDP